MCHNLKKKKTNNCTRWEIGNPNNSTE